MTLKIQSASVLSQLMKTSENPMLQTDFDIVQSGSDVETSTIEQPYVVYSFEDHAITQIEIPKKHISIGNLVSKWEKDDKRRAALEDARKWVADTFHGEDGETVRTMRLRKGWSQARLAQEISTSQSHIARIERGTENIAITTCRRLCSALDIDLNHLNQALVRQEAIAHAKAK